MKTRILAVLFFIALSFTGCASVDQWAGYDSFANSQKTSGVYFQARELYGKNPMLQIECPTEDACVRYAFLAAKYGDETLKKSSGCYQESVSNLLPYFSKVRLPNNIVLEYETITLETCKSIISAHIESNNATILTQCRKK